jgi:hypothetical protein
MTDDELRMMLRTRDSMTKEELRAMTPDARSRRQQLPHRQFGS